MIKDFDRRLRSGLLGAGTEAVLDDWGASGIARRLETELGVDDMEDEAAVFGLPLDEAGGTSHRTSLDQSASVLLSIKVASILVEWVRLVRLPVVAERLGGGPAVDTPSCLDFINVTSL
jgi:hypothetical protein